MKKQLIRLTENDLHNIINECVEKILKEDFQISLSNSGPEGFKNMQNWIAAMNELKTKGETIIHIPVDYDKIIDAKLIKNEEINQTPMTTEYEIPIIDCENKLEENNVIL